MAEGAPTNHRLLPWYIGIVLVLAAVIYVGYQMWRKLPGTHDYRDRRAHRHSDRLPRPHVPYFDKPEIRDHSCLSGW